MFNRACELVAIARSPLPADPHALEVTGLLLVVDNQLLVEVGAMDATTAPATMADNGQWRTRLDLAMAPSSPTT